MRLHTFDDPGAFTDLAGQFLADDPWSTNVIGVQVARSLTGARPPDPADRWWVVVDGSDPVGVAMRTPPFPLVISRMPAEAAAFLATELSAGRAQPGVNGEAAAIAAFVAAWETVTAEHSGLQVRMRFYRLDVLVPPTTTGHGRRAGASDVSLAEPWFAAFGAEALPHQADAPPHQSDRGHRELARRRLDAGEIWLWEDRGRPVSLAAVSPPAYGVVRIGPVYTPPECRRHGYGSAVTALAADSALRAGADHVALFADLANPTSNAIYQALGFLVDHDFEERRFLARSGG